MFFRHFLLVVSNKGSTFCVVKHKMNRITLIFKEDNKMKMLKSIWKRFGEADKHVWGYSTMY